MQKKAKSKSCAGSMGMKHEREEMKHVKALEKMHKGIKPKKKAK